MADLSGNKGSWFSGFGDILKKYGPGFVPALFSLFNKTPNAPKLPFTSSGDIRKFYQLKRYVGAGRLQRQASQASKSVASSLPASLRESTVPASFQTGIQNNLTDQLTQLESNLSQAEMDDIMKLSQLMQQQYQLEMQQDQAGDTNLQTGLQLLAFLPYL